MFPHYDVFGRQISMFLTMVSIAFLCAAWLFRRNLMKQGGDKYAYLIPSMTALGLGFGGSGLLATLEFGSLTDIFRGNLFSHGLSVHGGIIAVAIGFAIYALYAKTPALSLMSAGAGPLFLGYGIGRLACFFAGDGCYGTASDLPWAMAFPNGLHPTLVPVHPTPLYESGMALIMLGLVQWQFGRGHQRANQWRVLVLTSAGLGLSRFLVEFVRRNPNYGGLSQAQWIALGLLALAGVLWFSKVFGRNPLDTKPGNAILNATR